MEDDDALFWIDGNGVAEERVYIRSVLTEKVEREPDR
jgi:hypothetical protein